MWGGGESEGENTVKFLEWEGWLGLAIDVGDDAKWQGAESVHPSQVSAPPTPSFSSSTARPGLARWQQPIALPAGTASSRAALGC